MILLTSERLARIRSLSGTAIYQRTLASAEVGITATGEPENWWYRLVHAALMSVVENRSDLGLEAALRLHRILNDDARMLSWENYDQHYLYRSLANLALVYDWTKQYLTPAQDTRCREVLLHMAWRPWSIESFWGEDTIDSNYFGGYLLTGCLVAKATGDAALLTEMEHHCLDVLLWFTSPEGEGGCYFEAFNYCGFAVMRTVLALKAMGYDLSTIQWFKDSAKARIHTATPWGSNVLFGDNPQSSTGEFRSGDFLWTLCLIDNLPNPWRGELAFFLQQFSGKLQIQSGEDEGLHYALLWQDPSATPIDYRLTEPLVWHGGAVGLWTRRTNWQPGATYFFGSAGLVVYSHQMLSGGNVGFGKEGWISVGAALYSHGGGLGLQNGESQYCNVPLVAGRSQEKRYWEAVTADKVTVVSPTRLQMLARDPYNRTRAVCVDFSRVVEWISDTMFVVIDRVVPVEDGAVTEWNWHGLDWTPLLGGGDDVFALTSGDYSDFGARVKVLTGDNLDEVFDIDVTEDRSSDLGDAAHKISEALRVRTTAQEVAFVFEITKTPETSTVTATLNPDGSVTANGHTVQPPAPTGPLPEIVTGDGRETAPPSNGGPPPPPEIPPMPRPNSTTKVYYTNDTPMRSAVVEGLPSGVTIAKASVRGVQNSGWLWQFKEPPGAPLTVSGFALTWDTAISPNNPNTSYAVHIVGSDGLEETVPVEVRTGPPPPPATNWEQKYHTLKTAVQTALDNN